MSLGDIPESVHDLPLHLATGGTDKKRWYLSAASLDLNAGQLRK